MGVLLARAVKNNAALKTITTYPAAETIRATVVGAGTHTTNVSGSTISYTSGKLPIKNIPVLKISEEEEQEPAMFRDAIRRKLKLYEGENGLEQVAIVFSGKYHTTFAQLQDLSRTIAEGADEVIAGPHPLILVIENDIAKALGTPSMCFSCGKRISSASTVFSRTTATTSTSANPWPRGAWFR